MLYVEAPKYYKPDNREWSLFLAGGITDCPNWQQEIMVLLKGSDLVLFNPRRKKFPIHDSSAAVEQIKWERHHLELADEILFWFCKETLQPVVMHELGAWLASCKKIYVGVHPGYKRIRDVEIQAHLVRPEVEIVYKLEDLVEQIKENYWWL